jgi:hypothetical protein
VGTSGAWGWTSDPQRGGRDFVARALERESEPRFAYGKTVWTLLADHDDATPDGTRLTTYRLRFASAITPIYPLLGSPLGQNSRLREAVEPLSVTATQEPDPYAVERLLDLAGAAIDRALR